MLKGDRATPSLIKIREGVALSPLVGFKGHETVKIFYADANARITQNRGFDGRTIKKPWYRHDFVMFLVLKERTGMVQRN